MIVHPFVAECDGYLASRTGRYEWRCQRYDQAISAMEMFGLSNESTVFDVGAGWTELAARMVERGHRARYVPVDGCIDGTDLNFWCPPRRAEFFAALEIVEHLDNPARLIADMQACADRAVVVSTPNPATVDVLAMDPTHVTEVGLADLEGWGFDAWPANLYGEEGDGIVAVWTPNERGTT